MKLKYTHKGWLVFKWEPDLPLGVRWHHQINADSFVQGDTAENLPPPSEVEVLLILPGQDVTLHTITLASRRYEALMWQLEPLILSEMTEVFCVALEHKGEQHLMAVTARERLQACIEHIRVLGYETQRALPATLLLKAGSTLPDGDRIHVRLASEEGMTLQREQWLTLCDVKPQLTETESLAEVTLTQLATAAIACRYNLLQHDFHPRKAHTKSLRLTVLAAGGLILSILAEPLWQGWLYQQKTRQLTAELQARYQYFMPKEPLSQPRRQLQLKLDALRHRASSPSLLHTLHLSTPLLNALQPQRWQKMHWDARSLQLRIEYARQIEPSLLQNTPPGIQARAQQHHLTVSKKDEN
ncbi:type II secretion system protein GspL [Huaxiibacter chinensis]